MSLRPWLGIGLAALFVAAVALAQPPGGRGPGRGGFGPPGFGPPMFGGPFGMPASAAALLRMPEVRKELGTTDAQNKQIDALLAEQQEQMRAAFGAVNFQELQDLSEEERAKRFDEARKKSEQAARQIDDKLDKLLDAKQRGRLAQLRLQREGVAAFQRGDVAKQLGLTKDQQEKIRKLQPEGPPFFRGPGQDEKALADAVAALTDVQKAKWAELKGKEFKFPQFVGFGFGGPGGPMGQQRKLLKEFDKDHDGRLNKAERLAARESIGRNEC